MPSWIPRSVYALNEWLDKACETMIAQEIDVLSDIVDFAKDNGDMVAVATLVSNEIAA
jgi:tRNA A37 threonylcarbamoyltransferase TsaD